MDFFEGRLVCPNSDHGCEFVASSRAESYDHLQNDCQFHAVECFKCKRKVGHADFARHYAESCRGSSPLWDASQQKADAHEETTSARKEDEPATQFLQGRSGRRQESTQERVGESRMIVHEQLDTTQQVCSRTHRHLRHGTTSDSQVVQESCKVTSTWKERESAVQEEYSFQQCGATRSCEAVKPSWIPKDVPGLIRGTEAATDEQDDPRSAVKGSTRCHLISTGSSDVQAVQELGKAVPHILRSLEKVDDLVKQVAALTRTVEQLKEGMKRRLHRPFESGSEGGWIKCVDGEEAFWIVENVHECVGQGSKTCKTSGAFVLRGYSAKLEVQVKPHDGNLWIGVYLRLCRGPNDLELQWPFDIPYTLTLIHPEDLSKNKECSLTPPSGCPESFRKPECEENPGCGEYLCTVQHAKDEGYIEGGAICVAVFLHREE